MRSNLQIWKLIHDGLLLTICSSIHNPNVSTPVKESAKNLIHELEVEPQPHEKDPARVAAGLKAYEYLHRVYKSFLTSTQSHAQSECLGSSQVRCSTASSRPGTELGQPHPNFRWKQAQIVACMQGRYFVQTLLVIEVYSSNDETIRTCNRRRTY